MNEFEELKYNVEALYRAIGEDKKFFSPIYDFVEKLREFTTTNTDRAKKKELRFLAQKIEDFFYKYRPSPSLDIPYIPPIQASSNDDTVREIYRVCVGLNKLSQEEFEELKPKPESLAQSRPEQSLKGRLNEALAVIKAVCEAKGWVYRLDSLDKKNWKYASITVQRIVSGAGEIVGMINLSVNDGIRLSLSKTSFHDYGLPDLRESIMGELENLSWLEKTKKGEQPTQSNSTFHLERLLTRFPVVARQLKQRHEDRETLIIEDEYDVQDLLHALLKIYFEDVRPEEYAPSYAGSSSRMDFLLKKDGIVVEAKMASKTLRDKSVGEQLIVDINKYQSHPDCRTLYCVVYDPNSFVKNPVGLENDLSGQHDKLTVKVFVVPH